MSGNSSGVTDITVKVNGTQVEETDVHSFSVDQDLSQPDMCVLSLRNQGHKYSNELNHGDTLEISVGESSGERVFKGEVVALEPQYKVGGETKVLVRAYNKLHRLLRGRKSRTFLEQSDQDIASSIAGESGLTVSSGSDPRIVHQHVYQHNQTDLEFLRVRASRIGFEVWVDDSTLYFKPPEVDRDSGLTMRFGEDDVGGGNDILINAFTPRLSSAGMVKKVEVRGWDPDKKEEIVGTAEAASSKLGPKTGPQAASAFGDKVTYEVDHPIFSVEEANAIAKARLAEHLMGYITGEGTCLGDPRLKPGVVVTIVVNPDKSDDRFNGKYLVIGATHRYTHSRGGGGGGGGYTTAIRVSRDAEGG